MAKEHPLRTAVRAIRVLAGVPQQIEPADPQLLERFIQLRDEAAFAELVRRHGPMVRGVCRRLVHQEADADDAFQATFLVLLSRAGSIRKQRSLASWLYGVAYRLARRARARPPAANDLDRCCAGGDPGREAAWKELLAILDEELHALPAKYQAPLLLCHLQGQTRDQATRLLGWSLRTLDRRLEHGRELLRVRLSRRGLALPAALLVTALAQQAAASLPSGLQVATLRVATQFVARGPDAVAGLGSGVAALMAGAMKGVALARLQIVVVLVLLAALATAGAALFTHQAAAEKGMVELDTPPPGSDALEPPGPDRPDRARNDQYGDPLPPGALARLGTLRWCLPPYRADTMAVSPDGRFLVTANPVDGISVWEMATGKIIRQVPDGPELRKAWLGNEGVVALTADASTAAIGSPDGTIHLVDVHAGKEKRSWRGHGDHVQEAALSADGAVLVTRSADKTLRVWHTATGKQLHQTSVNSEPREQFRRNGLGIAADGKTFAWIGDEPGRAIHVCDVATGAELHHLGRHQGIARRAVVFSSDNRTLVSLSEAGLSQLWDYRAGRFLHEVPGKAPTSRTAAAFAPDAKTLIVTNGGDAMRLVDVATGKELWRVPRGSASTILDVFAFTPDKKTVIVAQNTHTLHRYDVATGRLLAGAERQGPFRAITFAPDDRSVYSLGDDKTLRAWDSSSGKALHATDVGTTEGVFSPDRKLLAAIKYGKVQVHELDTGKELRQLKMGRAYATAFSPNNRVLAVAGETGKGVYIAYWDLETGAELRQISPFKDVPFTNDFYAHYLPQIAFTPDGKRLLGHKWVTHSQGGSLHLWDVATDGEYRTHAAPASTLGEGRAFAGWQDAGGGPHGLEDHGSVGSRHREETTGTRAPDNLALSSYLFSRWHTFPHRRQRWRHANTRCLHR